MTKTEFLRLHGPRTNRTERHASFARDLDALLAAERAAERERCVDVCAACADQADRARLCGHNDQTRRDLAIEMSTAVRLADAIRKLP